jgi:hypothetical protein
MICVFVACVLVCVYNIDNANNNNAIVNTVNSNNAHNNYAHNDNAVRGPLSLAGHGACPRFGLRDVRLRTRPLLRRSSSMCMSPVPEAETPAAIPGCVDAHLASGTCGLRRSQKTNTKQNFHPTRGARSANLSSARMLVKSVIRCVVLVILVVRLRSACRKPLFAIWSCFFLILIFVSPQSFSNFFRNLSRFSEAFARSSTLKRAMESKKS